MLVFFFQAEDGIRDLTVTGVQTCALPICSAPGSTVHCSSTAESTRSPSYCTGCLGEDRTVTDRAVQRSSTRSEERRVGKECRCRGAPDHNKITKQSHRTHALLSLPLGALS